MLPATPLSADHVQQPAGGHLVVHGQVLLLAGQCQGLSHRHQPLRLTPWVNWWATIHTAPPFPPLACDNPAQLKHNKSSLAILTEPNGLGNAALEDDQAQEEDLHGTEEDD